MLSLCIDRRRLADCFYIMYNNDNKNSTALPVGCLIFYYLIWSKNIQYNPRALIISFEIT